MQPILPQLFTNPHNVLDFVRGLVYGLNGFGIIGTALQKYLSFGEGIFAFKLKSVISDWSKPDGVWPHLIGTARWGLRSGITGQLQGS